MSLDNVTPGPKAPQEFNVIIEIPMNADPVKYEVDKATGAIFVVSDTALRYLAPARLDDLLQVTVQPVETGRASMTLQQQAWRNNGGPALLLCEGSIRIGCAPGGRSLFTSSRICCHFGRSARILARHGSVDPGSMSSHVWYSHDWTCGLPCRARSSRNPSTNSTSSEVVHLATT